MKTATDCINRVKKYSVQYIIIAYLAMFFALLFAFSGCDIFEEEEGDPESPTSIATNVEIYQMDWYDHDGILVMENSMWGYVRWTYIPDRDRNYYINVSLQKDENSQPAWIIENLPLFVIPDTEIQLVDEGAYFNLSGLGLSPGENLHEAIYIMTLSEEIMSAEPFPANTNIAVETLRWFPTDSPNECPIPDPFEDPGTPEDIKINVNAAPVNPLRGLKPVQEGSEQCCAGAMARSIDWLNRKHSLGINKSAQQIYDDLIGADVGKPNDDGTTARDEWISRKDNYCKEMSNNRIETKVWESAPNMVDDIEGVTQVTGDFKVWLETEMDSGEDVEIAYYYPENSHIVTVAQVYKKDGDIYVKYRDDEKQGENTKGDKDIKNAKIYLKDGIYHFGSNKNIIFFAISESVNTK